MQELDYASIGIRIQNVRKAKGLSQGMLAKECGICLSFMGHIERGTRRMSLDTFASICKVLDTDADELLYGTACLSKTVMDMWNLSEQDLKKHSEGMGNLTGSRKSDSYGRYVRIMKSVAEIMNGD